MRSCADRARAAALPAAALLACAVASAGTEVKEALARHGPVELDAGGARVALARLAFSDVVVSTDGAEALVVAMVEADGRVLLEGAEPSLAYVGREAFRMERCPGRRWCLAPGALAGLRGVVAALAAAPRAPGARPVAWQVRVEREAAEAGEDVEAPDGPSSGPEARGGGAPRRLRVRHALARAGDGWRLAPAP
ncbi:MAG TPA: hypothetical protein VFL83_17740 [Anaeromyxobacter sp.]|nr:hypothetical protein [Anaeromyxobacter sp.]